MESLVKWFIMFEFIEFIAFFPLKNGAITGIQ